MFNVPTWSATLGCLYQAIGHGRQGKTGEVSLQLATVPAASGTRRVLSLIELSLEEQPVFAWVDEAAFIHWIEPALPVPDLASLAVDLHQAAVTWALTPWFDWCASCGLTPPAVKALHAPASVLKSLDIVLSLTGTENGRWLDLYLDAFPIPWLLKMAQAMTADPQPRDDAVTVYGSVGYACLSVAEINTLKAGDVVMAAKEAPIEKGSLWITLGQQLIQIRRLDERQFEVEQIHELIR